MSLVYDLEVYKKCYDLLISVFVAVKHYSREYKYNLGDRIKQEVLDVMLNIYRANVSENKSPYLQKGREHIEVLKLLIRLSKDLRLLSVAKYTELFGKTESISKQLLGWQKWYEQQNRSQ